MLALGIGLILVGAMLLFLPGVGWFIAIPVVIVGIFLIVSSFGARRRAASGESHPR